MEICSMDYEPNYKFTALLIIALMIMAIFMQPTFEINGN